MRGTFEKFWGVAVFGGIRILLAVRTAARSLGLFYVVCWANTKTYLSRLHFCELQARAGSHPQDEKMESDLDPLY